MRKLLLIAHALVVTGKDFDPNFTTSKANLQA
jgi:hypothetical protein